MSSPSQRSMTIHHKFLVLTVTRLYLNSMNRRTLSSNQNCRVSCRSIESSQFPFQPELSKHLCSNQWFSLQAESSTQAKSLTFLCHPRHQPGVLRQTRVSTASTLALHTHHLRAAISDVLTQRLARNNFQLVGATRTPTSKYTCKDSRG